MSPMHVLPPVAQTPPQLYCQLIAAGVDAAALRSVRDACLLAATNTRHLLRGSGKPFVCHLVGVASLVAEATGDLDLVVAGLLHALSQQRVLDVADASIGADVGLVVSGRVRDLLRDYAVAGDLQATAAAADADDRRACDVRILQLADQLEDGLDGGPWWHGNVTDCGNERGSAGDRVARLRGLATQFEIAPALGAPMLLDRFNALMATWEHGQWPPSLRSGCYSSYAPTSVDAS